jgi:hypothetical protein
VEQPAPAPGTREVRPPGRRRVTAGAAQWAGAERARPAAASVWATPSRAEDTRGGGQPAALWWPHRLHLGELRPGGVPSISAGTGGRGRVPDSPATPG